MLLKQDYTKEQIISKLQEYYYTYDKVPTTIDLQTNKDLPRKEKISELFGSYKNALIESDLYQYKKQSMRTKISKEEAITAVVNFVLKHNRKPYYVEFNSDSSLPSLNNYYKYSDSINEAISYLNIKINIKRHKDDETLIKEIHEFYLEIGKVPSLSEVNKQSHLSSRSVYLRRFGSWKNVLGLANIPYNEVNFKNNTSKIKSYTPYVPNEEVINKWFQLNNLLKRIPTLSEIKDSKYDISWQIKSRWGNYQKFLDELGIDIDISSYSKCYWTKEGVQCQSYIEYKLTNWLEENNVKFKKDYPYRLIIPNDKTNRTVDWRIEYNNQTFYVEYFGMSTDAYKENMSRKINDFTNCGYNLIELYPESVHKKTPEQIFSFLF